MSIIAPPINERQRIPEQIIRDLISQIAQHFHPLRIILFGSYAYGTPRPESDVDLLVVMETSLPSLQQAVKIRQKVKPMFGVDILVYTPTQLEQRTQLGDSFLQEVVRKGSMVYESSDA